jgi:hypothetical protein
MLNRWTHSVVGAAAIVAAAGVLVGCGSDGSGDPAAGSGGSSQGDDGTTYCADVWQEGKVLPSDYDGWCARADSSGEGFTFIAECPDGRRLTSHQTEEGEVLWAWLGEAIQVDPEDGEVYSDAKVYNDCEIP